MNKYGSKGNILFIMLGGIGDTIVCTPAMRCIRDAFPYNRIILLGREPFCHVVPKTLVDEIRPYPTTILGKLRLAATLFAESFFISFDFHTPTVNTVCSNTRVFTRNAFFSAMAFADMRCGFMESVNRYILNRGVNVSPHDVKKLNIVFLTAQILKGVGISCNKLPDKETAVPEKPSALVSKTYEKLGLKGGFCVMHLGSKQGAKKWDAMKGAEVSKALNKNLGLKTVIIGDDADRLSGKEITACTDGYVVNLAGEISLADTAWLISRCSIAICVDSGPMHMADALKVPLVAMFGGQQDNSVWYPLSRNVRVLKGTAPCSPCYRADCPDNKCMSGISAGDVIKAAMDLWEKNQQAMD